MASLIFAALGSFALCLMLTPIARHLAIASGLVDRPDGRRKMHSSPIAVAGGLAMVVAISATLWMWRSLAPAWATESLPSGFSLPILFGAWLAIAGLGLVDDVGMLRGRTKFVGQIAIATLLLCHDWQVEQVNLLGLQIELGLLAKPFTLFWLVGAINSLNLLDGMDGLLGLMATLMALALAAIAALHGQWVAVVLGLALAGVLSGFLCFNFPPATIFMGDAGSMFVGLALGCLTILASTNDAGVMSLTAPLAVWTLPLFDTATAIVRRKMTGRSVYTTDRAHFHHCLLRSVQSPHMVLLLLSCFSLPALIGAIASVALNMEWLALIPSVVAIAFVVLTGIFGRSEWYLFCRRLGHLILSFVSFNKDSRETHVRFQGSCDWERLLAAITNQAFELNLKTVRIDVNAPAIHEGYHAKWDRFDEELRPDQIWRVDMPLTLHNKTVGTLGLVGLQDVECISRKIAGILTIIEQFQRDLPVIMLERDSDSTADSDLLTVAPAH